jgi:Flp pilus assembly protein TadD
MIYSEKTNFKLNRCLPLIIVLCGSFIGAARFVDADNRTDKLLESARNHADSYRHCEIAQEEAEQVIALEPKNIEAYLIKAQCQDYLVGAPAAMATLKYALRINSRNWDCWKMLGTLYDAQRQYDQAIQAYSQALSINPKDVDILHLRAMAYAENKRSDLAIIDMTRCIQLDSKKGMTYMWRACAYEQNQNLVDALADITMAIQLAPPAHKYEYIAHRAEIFTKMNRQKEAIVDYNLLLKANALDDTFLLKRGDCKMALGDYSNAIKDYTQTIDLNDTSTAYFARSKAYEKLGMKELAAKDKAVGEQLLKRKAVSP